MTTFRNKNIFFMPQAKEIDVLSLLKQFYLKGIQTGITTNELKQVLHDLGLFIKQNGTYDSISLTLMRLEERGFLTKTNDNGTYRTYKINSKILEVNHHDFNTKHIIMKSKSSNKSKTSNKSTSLAKHLSDPKSFKMPTDTDTIKELKNKVHQIVSKFYNHKNPSKVLQNTIRQYIWNTFGGDNSNNVKYYRVQTSFFKKFEVMMLTEFNCMVVREGNNNFWDFSNVNLSYNFYIKDLHKPLEPHLLNVKPFNYTKDVDDVSEYIQDLLNLNDGYVPQLYLRLQIIENYNLRHRTTNLIMETPKYISLIKDVEQLLLLKYNCSVGYNSRMETNLWGVNK